MPGFINSELDIDLGTIQSSSGTVNIYFDFVNTTSTAYQATATGGSGVTLTTSGTIAGSKTPIENITTAAISGTITLTIQFSGTTGSIDLDGISISFSEYTAPYERVDAEGNPDPNGDFILFGYYPQTIAEEGVVDENAVQQSNGYYLGNDGEYYAQVVAIPYNSNYIFSDETAIVSGETYYFKVEPIKWRILDDAYGDGTALIVSYIIINSMAYQSKYVEADDGRYYVTGYEGSIFANNYEHSEVRKWLINDFYDTAFTGTQQSLINTTEVVNTDNSFDASLGFHNDEYLCENTFDKIFLLSLANIHNANYGYFEDTSYDANKAIIASDYAKVVGAYIYRESTTIGSAWLRSPSDYDLDVITADVGSWGTYSIDDSSIGVLPALQIQL